MYKDIYIYSMASTALAGVDMTLQSNLQETTNPKLLIKRLLKIIKFLLVVHNNETCTHKDLILPASSFCLYYLTLRLPSFHWLVLNVIVPLHLELHGVLKCALVTLVHN